MSPARSDSELSAQVVVIERWEDLPAVLNDRRKPFPFDVTCDMPSQILVTGPTPPSSRQ